jgi:hypothetical protein
MKYKRFLIFRLYFLIIIVIQNFLFRNFPESFLLSNFCEISWNFFFKSIFCGSIIIFNFLLFQNCSTKFKTLFKFSSDYHKLCVGDKPSHRIKYSLGLLFLVLIVRFRFTVYSFWFSINIGSINIGSGIIEALSFRL